MAGGFFTTSTWGNYINDCLANIEQNVTGCRLEKEVEAIFLFENPAVWPSSPKYVIGTRSQAEFEADSRNARGLLFSLGCPSTESSVRLPPPGA